MGEALAARYWCHLCSQVVNPVMEVEIQCPFCESGFVEEMGSRSGEDTDLGTDRALSLWARILLGMLGTSSRRRRLRREEDVEEEEEEEEEEEDEEEEEVEPWREVSELERDLELIQRRRRRSPAALLQLLQGLQVPTGIMSESENSETERERDRERVILINPFNQTITLQDGSSLDLNQNQSPPPGSLGNYLTGPGLEILLQHLVENDPNRYGTPPTQRDVIEAMPNVIIRDNLQCSVCLDDFEIGTEAKEMPCKHKFHSGCILPWLELHSSCPVCRFQMPTIDGSKADEDGSENSSTV
ncbi:zinc finger protein [Macleaya cordata]|uniref:RING-type E3 ubiquitin transferase n=1 Tax=Macleaya cordata TaxID=56857 RepID=A0A200QS17_MACCD|nr:zinc finger protein [Macleaya cordata]